MKRGRGSHTTSFYMLNQDYFLYVATAQSFLIALLFSRRYVLLPVAQVTYLVPSWPFIGFFRFISATMYFYGSQSQWSSINNSYCPNDVYFYSANEPTQAGFYWHMVNDVPTPCQRYNKI